MTKVGFVLRNDPYYQKKLQFLITFRSYFEKHGIVFSGDEPDIVLVHSSRLADTALREDTAYIVCGEHECALPYNNEFEALRHPSVRYLYRHCTLKTVEDYNAPALRQGPSFGLHLARVPDAPGAVQPGPPPFPIDPAMADRIRPNLFIPLHPYVIEMGRCAPDLAAEKQVDVCAIFSMIPEEKDRALHLHRRQAMNAVEALDVPRKFLRDRPAFAKKDWYALLQASRICVNPWGWGEFRWADLEAFYFGCLVVKPRSDFCRMWPIGFTDGVDYIACREDFADLGEVVAGILADPGRYEEMRQRNHQAVRASYDPEVALVGIRDDLLGAVAG